MSFSYYRARDARDAISMATSQPRTAFVAGGTDLMQLFRAGITAPGLVIDIGRFGLDRIESRESDRAVVSVEIGALARMSDVAAHPLICSAFPALAEALLASASPQVRHMGTIGGNLLQRTRCTYFRNSTLPCNKRQPGSGCGALSGENRLHALFGTSAQCVATHASDAAVALSALEANVQLLGRDSARNVSIDNFFLPPGTEPARETVLAPGELVMSVEIPCTALTRHSRYLKVRDRASFEFAVVSVAAGLQIADGRILAARISAGGVGTTPWRLRQCEALLVDVPVDAPSLARAAAAATEEAQPLSANGFKMELLRRSVLRVLHDLANVPQRDAV